MKDPLVVIVSVKTRMHVKSSSGYWPFLIHLGNHDNQQLLLWVFTCELSHYIILLQLCPQVRAGRPKSLLFRFNFQQDSSPLQRQSLFEILYTYSSPNHFSSLSLYGFNSLVHFLPVPLYVTASFLFSAFPRWGQANLLGDLMWLVWRPKLKA